MMDDVVKCDGKKGIKEVRAWENEKPSHVGTRGSDRPSLPGSGIVFWESSLPCSDGFDRSRDSSRALGLGWPGGEGRSLAYGICRYDHPLLGGKLFEL